MIVKEIEALCVYVYVHEYEKEREREREREKERQYHVGRSQGVAIFETLNLSIFFVLNKKKKQAHRLKPRTKIDSLLLN